ncbi:MAG TPA: hypothetical protein VG734_26195 [Lacunisphaera sp.]|nr:hypothetical protein [Lacunisphaera sp.]
MPKVTHVDDWLDTPGNAKEHPAAHAFFEAFRRPAHVKLTMPYDGKLFCTWRGARYRVTGCSRMGDVWLHSKLDWNEDKDSPFYEHRVAVDECSEWGTDG